MKGDDKYWRDVMTWRHDAITWTKLKIIQISELSDMKTMETKKESTF